MTDFTRNRLAGGLSGESARLRTVVAVLVLAAYMVGVAATHAQRGSSRISQIGYVYPAGGQQGTAFRVTVGGRYLGGVSQAIISGDGVEARVINYIKPMTQKQFNECRTEYRELQKRKLAAKSWTPADEKLVDELKVKIAAFIKRPPAPAIVENVILEIKVESDAAIGDRDIRLKTPLGLTNPLVFQVGQYPEFSTELEKSRGEPSRGRAVNNNPPTAIPVLTLPVIINGQIMPGLSDKYLFHATEGQKLVVAVSARQLIPYLPDAVPGWFQATLALFDNEGREVAYVDDYRFHPDPVLHYKIPKSGDYVIEIKDAIYRGRDDFVYRITIGELPFVTGIFPLGSRVGDNADVTVAGWNLPTASLKPGLNGNEPGVYPVAASDKGTISNFVPFALDTLPECLELENRNKGDAQRITTPIIINGRIDYPGDWDTYSFKGKTHQQIVVEIIARKLNSPVDSVIRLTTEEGRQLAFNDDYEDKGAGLTTHHADSWLRYTLPEEGVYHVRVGDAQHQGGAGYAYRLRISPPRPDFGLRVVPSSITVRPGAKVPLTIYALRRDGFTGAIRLALKGCPEGFKLAGDSVPANKSQVKLTLEGVRSDQREPFALSVVGHAIIEGKQVTRQAVPAEDRMQAFLWRHLVPAREMEAVLVGKASGRLRRTSQLLRRLKALDRDGDDKLQRSEIPKTHRATIMKADTNGDNVLDRRELENFFRNNPQTPQLRL